MRSRSSCADGAGRRPRAGVPTAARGLLVVLLFAPLLAGAAADTSDTSNASEVGEELRGAARAGDVDAIVGLLAGGAAVDATGPDGETALHVAAAKGRADAVRALLAGGANVDRMEYDGDTALVNAAWFGHAQVARILLAAGADATIEGSAGASPLRLARQRGHSDVARLLREHAKRSVADAGERRPPRANTPPTPAPQRPATRLYRPGYAQRIAAVIGVNDYEHWPSLRGARPDAEKMAERLRALGFDAVLELYDGAATRRAILSLLGRSLLERVGENDLVVIFFAGHGETETVEAGRKRGYIVPADATRDDVFSTAISMQELRALSDRLPAKHVYYAMDSCYSGLGLTRGLGVVKPGESDYFGKITSLRAVQMVTAGGEGEEAIERDGSGVFTRSLLDAIDGEADANGDGYVTATEIGAYVAPRVTNETGARQSPQAGRLEGEGEIAFEVKSRR